MSAHPRYRRPAIDPETLRALSTVSPWRGVVAVCLQWLIIIAAAIVCEAYWHPLLYALTIAVIGARQHGLAVLIHEGAHHRLTPARRLNDWIGEALCAWPLLVTLHRYRGHHLQHHRWLHTQRDPDLQRKQTPEWQFPQPPLRFLTRLIFYGFGLGILRTLHATQTMRETTPLPREMRLARLVLYIGGAGALTALGSWQLFLLYWVVPLLTWLQLILQVRSIAEHFAIPENPEGFGPTRTTLPTLPDRLFIAPQSVGYHLEHHAFPSVPAYNLARLHGVLMASPDYRRHAHITRGYLGVLREATRVTSEAPGEAR